MHLENYLFMIRLSKIFRKFIQVLFHSTKYFDSFNKMVLLNQTYFLSGSVVFFHNHSYIHKHSIQLSLIDSVYHKLDL